MPFKTAKQELAMQINAPDVWRAWVRKYGHHPDYFKLKKKIVAKGKKKKRKPRKGKKK